MNNTNELQHFGVLGMRWGVRRGSSSSNRANSQKKVLSEAEIRDGRRNVAKKTLFIGAAVVGVGIAAYGSYKVSKFAKSHSKEISDAKRLVKMATSIKTRSKSVPSSSSVRLKSTKRILSEAEKAKIRADSLKDIKTNWGEKPKREDINEVLSRHWRIYGENQKKLQEIKRDQDAWEAIHGTPTLADFAEARQRLEKQGIKFP